MNTIEVKELHGTERNYLSDYQEFGWVYVRDGGPTHSYRLERDTKMPHYDELESLCDTYETAKSGIKEYHGPKFSTCLILFILFIFPMVIYLVAKNFQKKSILEKNSQKYEIMRNAISKARKLTR